MIYSDIHRQRKGLIIISKILYATGLTKSVLEYIENISFSDEIQAFEKIEDCCKHIVQKFKIGSPVSEDCMFNRYLCKNCSGLLFLGNQGVGHGNQDYMAEVLTTHLKSTDTDNLTFGSDILNLYLSKQFYVEYELVDNKQKELISQMLLKYAMDIYMEYLKSNEAEEITYAFALHTNKKTVFHVHRFYGYKTITTIT